MKVLIQDIGTGEYLAADGNWVATPRDARDFQTLLRAYNFARENISGRFQVLLYCPEDHYSACIIEGVGSADASAETADTMVQVKQAPYVRKSALPEHSNW